MIQNLNQVNFQGFGTVLPERAQANQTPPKNAVQIKLPQPEAAVFRTKADTLLSCSGNMCVLSVSKDGQEYQHYYLDKSVSLREGLLFSLNVYKTEATVILSTDVQPEKVGTDVVRSMRIDSQLRVAGIYTFFYQEKEQGFLFSGESHPMPEFTYVDQGSLHSVADGQDWLLHQGDAMIYAPNQWHMQYNDLDVSVRFLTIAFDLESELAGNLSDHIFDLSSEEAAFLRQILHECDMTDAYSGDFIRGYLKLLLLSVLRDAGGGKKRLQTPVALNNENAIVSRALQYIADHVYEKLPVETVAREIGVSASHLTALFHRQMDISPGEYIRRVKLEESKCLIREGKMNFSQIAAALHYSTIHHFSRQFKDKFGISPSEYAKSLQASAD